MKSIIWNIYESSVVCISHWLVRKLRKSHQFDWKITILLSCKLSMCYHMISYCCYGSCFHEQGVGLKLEDALAFWKAEFSQKVRRVLIYFYVTRTWRYTVHELIFAFLCCLFYICKHILSRKLEVERILWLKLHVSSPMCLIMQVSCSFVRAQWCHKTFFLVRICIACTCVILEMNYTSC